MSLIRRKPAPVPSEGPSWAAPGTAKHASPEPSPADATGPVPPALGPRGSHRASTPPASLTAPAADQA